MNRPERAARTGTSPGHRPRTTRLLAGLLAALLGVVGLALVAAAPAAADPITDSTDFTLSCVAQTPLGPQAASFPLTIGSVYEETVSRGQTTQLRMVQPALDIPTQIQGFTVVNVTNVVVRLEAPKNFQVLSTALTGSNYPTTGWNSGGSGSIGYSGATNLVTLTIPGPVVPPVNLLPPEVVMNLKAIGKVGSFGDLKFDSFQLNAVINVSGIGNVSVAMSCAKPTPNPSLAHLTVASGSFTPTRENVTQALQTYGSCTLNVGGQGGFLQTGVDFRTVVVNPRFVMSGPKDVRPGDTAQLEVAMDPFDFAARHNTNSPTINTLLGGTTMSKLALAAREFRVDFEPPAGFTVQSVSTGTGMTATYNSTTNRIRWARPTGAAGAVSGAFSPPSLIVNLSAPLTPGVTAPVTFSPLRFKGLGYSIEHENWTNLILAPIRGSNSVKNVNCNQGGQASGNANAVNFPVNPSGAPSNTLPPSSPTPYNQRIGWPVNITAFPAALNVGTWSATTATAEAAWANNGVVGTIGKANRPTATNDNAGTVQNDGDSLTIPILANDVNGSSVIDPTSVEIIDFPENGILAFNPDGSVVYTPDLATPEKEDVFTYVVSDTPVAGTSPCPAPTLNASSTCNQQQVTPRISNLAQVDIDIYSKLCYVDDPRGECTPSGPDTIWQATQFITAQVVGDALTMEQADGHVTLFEDDGLGVNDLVLDGTPKAAVGLLNTIEIIDRRGEGGKWDVTGQVTDFKESDSSPNCPASNPGTWYFKCIPGDNLGWEPSAGIVHIQVPGDVSLITQGSAIGSGLQSAQQKLCAAPETQAGGTFHCDADLTLVTPASAAAQTYSATLTITIVG